MVLADGVPAGFKQLPGSEQILTKATGEFDLIITVDCSDLKRVGGALNGYRPPDIVIDHHVTTDAFGALNLIEPEAVATASVLTRYMSGWGLNITPPIAANLMTGLVTDTLGFRTSNTTPEVLRQAADLLELGVDMSTLYFRSLVRRTFPAAKYWGAGLTSLQRADGIIWATLTMADRTASGYTGSDDADLINVVSSIDEAEAAIIFVEQGHEQSQSFLAGAEASRGRFQDRPPVQRRRPQGSLRCRNERHIGRGPGKGPGGHTKIHEPIPVKRTAVTGS